MTTSIHKPHTRSLGELHWDINAIVSELRELRQASLAARRRADKPAKLPSRTTLTDDRRELDRCCFRIAWPPTLWSVRVSIIMSATCSTKRCENLSNRWSGNWNLWRAKMPPAMSTASRP